MHRTFQLLFALGLCALGQAATTNTNITINGTGTSNFGAYSVTGTVALSAFGNGTITSQFNSAVLLSNPPAAPITLTINTGSTTGTLTGTFAASAQVLLQILTGSSTASGSGTITITAGTGGFAGATGSFNVTGAGSGSGTSSSGNGGFTITGSGSITLPGSSGNTGSTGATGGTGSTTGSNTPAVTAIQDAASYSNGIAQGSIFVIKGTNLSGSGFTQNSGFPLSTTLAGVSVSFTPAGGGASTNAYMIYTYNQGGVNQLAALLPSTVAPGNYSVTVTNNGVTGATFTASVVKSKLGLITRDSTGSGLAVVQNYVSATQLDIDAYTTQSVSGTSLSPAKPGQTLIAYGTGFGPATGADNVASPGYDFTANGVTVQVMVGGMAIKPLYAGRTPGSAGLDQINFTLPSNVPTGCNVGFQISVNGTLTSMTYLSIAPSASATACVQPGFTTAQLQQFDQGGSFTSAGFTLTSFSGSFTIPGGVFTGKDDFLAGQFTTFSGTELAGITANPRFTPQGACTVTISGQGVTPAASGTNLDAGPVSVAGPSGSGLSGPLSESASSVYTYTLGFETPVSTGVTGLNNTSVQLVPGNYTITGAGGKDVGKFTATVTLGSPVTVTGGLPSSITRDSGLTVSWTGGNPTDWVELNGTATGNPTTSFTCFGSIGDGKMTVPASVLDQLPAAAAGTLYFVSGPNASFTAPLTAGGSVTGYLSALVWTISNSVSYK